MNPRRCPECNTPCECPDLAASDMSSLRQRLIAKRPHLSPVIDDLKDTHLAQLRIAILADYRAIEVLSKSWAAHNRLLAGEAAGHHGTGLAISKTPKGRRMTTKVEKRVSRELTNAEVIRNLMSGIERGFDSLGSSRLEVTE